MVIQKHLRSNFQHHHSGQQYHIHYRWFSKTPTHTFFDHRLPPLARLLPSPRETCGHFREGLGPPLGSLYLGTDAVNSKNLHLSYSLDFCSWHLKNTSLTGLTFHRGVEKKKYIFSSISFSYFILNFDEKNIGLGLGNLSLKYG